MTPPPFSCESPWSPGSRGVGSSLPFPLGLPGPCPGRPRDQRLSVPALPRRWLVPGAPLSEATAPVRPQVLIDWINDVLVEERIIVKQLEEDLYDGQVLQKLLGESPGRGGPRTLHGAMARGSMAPRWQPLSSRLRGAPGHLLSHCHSWVSPQRSPPRGCVDHTQLPKLSVASVLLGAGAKGSMERGHEWAPSPLCTPPLLALCLSRCEHLQAHAGSSSVRDA